MDQRLSQFSIFPALPLDIRMMMIEKMESMDRCNFSVSSKRSYAEAKASKNFLRGLEITIFDVNTILVGVTHYPSEGDNRRGYCLHYSRRENGTKSIKRMVKNYVNNGIQEEELISEVEVPDAVDLLKTSMKYFRKLVLQHQNFIKVLKMKVVPNDILVDFGITRLSSLEEFAIHDDENGFSQLLPQPKLPLKKLKLHGRKANEMFFEKIYETEKDVDLTCSQLTYDQFVQFRALNVFIPMGYTSERHLFNFVTNWQASETAGPRELFFTLFLENSNFNRHQFFDLCGQTINGEEEKTVTLSHHTQPRKFAILESSATFVSILFYETFPNSLVNSNLRRLNMLCKEKRAGRRQPDMIF